MLKRAWKCYTRRWSDSLLRWCHSEFIVVRLRRGFFCRIRLPHSRGVALIADACGAAVVSGWNHPEGVVSFFLDGV